MDHSDPIIKAFQELSQNYELTVDQELRKSWGVRYSDFVEQVLQFADIQKNSLVLDIATGTGLIPRTIASIRGLNCDIVGLDITYQALSIGKSKIEWSYEAPFISFTCATANALPFAPGSFDYVICALATHHINQNQLLEQVSLVLKPGGRFIMTDVIASPSWRYPGIRFFLRLASFLYFLFAVSPARAWAESMAVLNVHTETEWITALRSHYFSDVQIRKPEIHRTWAPSAIMMAATKYQN